MASVSLEGVRRIYEDRGRVHVAVAALWLVAAYAQADTAESFLQALRQRDITAAQLLFVKNQPDVVQALERALVTETDTAARRYRSAARAVQSRVRSAALSEIVSLDPESLKRLYAVKEEARLRREEHDLAGARQSYLASLSMAKALSWRWQQQRFQLLLADTFSETGQLEEANRWLVQALALEDPQRITHLDSMIHEYLGANYQRLGDLYLALQHYRRALELHAAIDYVEGIATEANNLATLFV